MRLLGAGLDIETLCTDGLQFHLYTHHLPLTSRTMYSSAKQQPHSRPVIFCSYKLTTNKKYATSVLSMPAYHLISIAVSHLLFKIMSVFKCITKKRSNKNSVLDVRLDPWL